MSHALEKEIDHYANNTDFILKQMSLGKDERAYFEGFLSILGIAEKRKELIDYTIALLHSPIEWKGLLRFLISAFPHMSASQQLYSAFALKTVMLWDIQHTTAIVTFNKRLSNYTKLMKQGTHLFKSLAECLLNINSVKMKIFNDPIIANYLLLESISPHATHKDTPFLKICDVTDDAASVSLVAKEIKQLNLLTYKSISPEELYTYNAQKSGSDNAPNIHVQSKQFNGLTNVILKTILAKQRKDIIKQITFWLQVSAKLSEYSLSQSIPCDFQGIKAIHATLENHHIQRLFKTLSLPKAEKSLWEELKKLFELTKNQSAYRECSKDLNPCLPFFGLILRDVNTTGEIENAKERLNSYGPIARDFIFAQSQLLYQPVRIESSIAQIVERLSLLEPSKLEKDLFEFSNEIKPYPKELKSEDHDLLDSFKSLTLTPSLSPHPEEFKTESRVLDSFESSPAPSPLSHSKDLKSEGSNLLDSATAPNLSAPQFQHTKSEQNKRSNPGITISNSRSDPITNGLKRKNSNT